MKLTSKVTPLTGIDFNEQNRVEFIEFLAGIDGDIQPQIYGVNAFEVGADELYDILEEKNDGEIDDSEDGYSYAFLNSNVGIWRQETTESVEEMIEEAEEEGEKLDTAEIEYERRKAEHWATLGIGTEGYY